MCISFRADTHWQPVQAYSQLKLSGLVLGRRPLGAVLHSASEPGELSQWRCHDNSTVNIVLVVIIIIITGYALWYRSNVGLEV